MSNLKVPAKTAERKTERIEILATKSQVKKIDAHAKKTGLNRSQYLLARGEKRTYTMARHLPDPDYAKLMLNLRELKAQGNNLNQLTRAVHLARLNGHHYIGIDEAELQKVAEANQQATQAILNYIN